MLLQVYLPCRCAPPAGERGAADGHQDSADNPQGERGGHQTEETARARDGRPAREKGCEISYNILKLRNTKLPFPPNTNKRKGVRSHTIF